MASSTSSKATLPRRIALAAIAVLVFSLLLLARCQPSGNPVTTPLVGHWRGNAKIIVSWCEQESLPVAIDIATDGSVTGKVGDATLVNGKISHNRGWLGRKLDLKTDLIITGGLAGAIVAAESISRDGVNIPLNFEGGELSGGLHSHGSETGGKDSMKLSASSLTLKMSVQAGGP